MAVEHSNVLCTDSKDEPDAIFHFVTPESKKPTSSHKKAVTLTATQIANDEGMKHFIGFVLQKTGCSHLFTTGQIANENPDFVDSQWLQYIDQGKLAYAKTEVYEDVKKMECLFQAFHENSKDGLLRIEGVVAKFAAALVQHFPQYSTKMLERYAFARTMVRLKDVKVAVQKQTESARSKTKRIQYCH